MAQADDDTDQEDGTRDVVRPMASISALGSSSSPPPPPLRLSTPQNPFVISSRVRGSVADKDWIFEGYTSEAAVDMEQQHRIRKVEVEVEDLVELQREYVFNVEEATTTRDYENFIHSLRIHREKIARFQLQHSNSYKIEKFLDIVLQTCSHETKLRLYQESFKLVGYHMEENDQWLEFGHTHTWRKYPPTHIIPHSSFLEFNSYHSCILRELGQGQTLRDIFLGRHQLITAIDLLATSTNRRRRAWSLIVVMMMICESVRFTFLFHHLTAKFLHTHPLPPHFLVIVSQREFDSMTIMSIMLPGQVRHTTFSLLMEDFARYCQPNAQLGYLNLQQYRQMPIKEPSPSRLLEVFSLEVVSIRGDSCGDFYGTISFRDPFFTEHIYSREIEESEVISSGDSLVLTGPSSCITIKTEDIGFNFVIFGKKILNTHTQIRWQDLKYVCDEPLHDEFVTDECSLMLSFIVLSNAMQATVEVTIVDMDRGGAHVSAKIFARLAEFGDYDIILFQTDHVEIHPGKVLQLSRSAVAVPWNSSVMIGVQLYDGDDEGLYLVKGIANFCTRSSGSFVEKICRSCIEIQVTVTWK